MSVYKRGKTYWVRFQWEGQEVRQSARTTSRSAALEFERKLREEYGRVYRGGTTRITYREAMERFITDYLPSLKPSTQQRYRVSAKQLHPYFKDMHLDEIGRAAIAHYQAERRKEGANPATINRDMTCLSSMLSCACDWEYIESNPLLGMRKKKLKEKGIRTRFLTREEYRRLLPELSGVMRAMVIVSVETGLRQEELFSLEWSQVDIRRREIMLSKTKTDTPRIVPLSQSAAAQISAQPRRLDNSYVFNSNKGTRYSQPYTAYRKAAKRAKINDLTWHDLRRTFASWWVQDDRDIYQLSKILGHASVKTTERSYAHLKTDNLHKTMGTSAQKPAQTQRSNSKTEIQK